MSYPLENFPSLKRGYKFMQPTSYSKHHLGTDYIVPVGTKLIAPFSGQCSYVPFAQGGKVANLEFTLKGKKYVARFMHNSSIISTGYVNEGQVIALTGNTGTLTTGPHSHIDISNNRVDVNNLSNFLDPDKFPWVQNQGVGMQVSVGVTVEALVDTIGYDQPGAGHEKQNIKKGQLGEITVREDDNWCVVNFAGAYTYWVMQKDFRAVPRGTTPSDADAKLAQAKELAKVIQATSSKQLAL